MSGADHVAKLGWAVRATLGLVLASAALGGQAAAAPATEVRILERDQRALLRSGVMRVQVTAPRSSRVRLTATVRRGRRTTRLGARRFVQSRAGTRTVRIRLTRSGRRALAGCASGTLSVIARVRRAPARQPVFTAGRPARDSAPLGVRAASCGGSTSIRAGAANVDITPPVGTPMFAYTARSGIANPENAPELALQVVADPDKNLYAKSFVASRGIHTRVRARAVVIETPRGKFALVQADLGGVPYALTQEVQRRIADTGIAADRLMLSATHTHSSAGPIWPNDSAGYALLGGDAFDPRTFEFMAAGISRSVLEADARLEPARVGVGSAEVDGASSNRGFDAFRRNADVPADEEAARAASVDRRMTVVRVDSAAGRPLAVWSNFAIHPTSFGDENLLFSGDNAGYAERIAERGIAADARRRGLAPRRPPVNVWTNSSEGDVSPRGEPDKVDGEAVQYAAGPFAEAHLPGARIGDGIVRAWRAAGDAMRGSVEIDARRTFIGFDGTEAEGEPVGPVPVLGAGGITAPDGFCAPFDNFAGPGQGRKFPALAGVGLVPQAAPVTLWRIGSLGIGAFPVEITKQMGQRIANGLAARSGGALDRVVIAGLSDAYVSYASTPEEYDGCQYEGSFTLWGRRLGPRYLDVAYGLVDPLLNGGAAPPGAPEPSSSGTGVGQVVEPRVTPDAGAVVAEPEPSVRRYERAQFRWRGGDLSLEAPAGQAFVSLERRDSGGEWRTVATDDGFADTVERDRDDVWTETFQFGPCDPLGTYRFHVRGRADRGAGPAPYEAISRSFELGPTAPLQVLAPVVAGTTVTVRALYPDPGEQALLALPRLVDSGEALLDVTAGGTTRRVSAPADPAGYVFSARVREGATVRVVRLNDRCGNASG